MKGVMSSSAARADKFVRRLSNVRNGRNLTFPSKLRCAAAAVALLIPTQGDAKGREERWIAFSTTAMGVTGDILLSPTRLRTAGHDIPLQVAADDPAFGGDDGPVRARILRITRRMDPRLLRGNTLCGVPARWIAVWHLGGKLWSGRRGKMLEMAVFTGERQPQSVNDAGLCATYSYTSPDFRP
jgi:hypothetical protein